MRKFFRSFQFKVIAAVLAVLLAGGITAAATYNSASPVSTVFGTIFEPLHQLTAKISGKFSTWGGSFVSSGTYQAENEELKKQIEQYQNELADYEEMRRQNEQYEQLLQIKEQHPDQQYETAIVIGRDSSDPFGGFTINTGSTSGVSVNDPVISGSYLVGIVTEVQPTYSKVRTLLDPKINVSAYEIRTREEGYASGMSELAASGMCRLSGLDTASAVSPGGVVYTSGVGGVFPRDLIVGTVTEVRSSESDISSYAVLKPGVDILSLQDVTVITSFDGQNTSPDESGTEG